MKRETPIPKYKTETVRELGELMKNKNTILVASIKNIPGSQFQEIVKKLRGKAIVKVPKKNLVFRAIDTSENKDVGKLKEELGDSFAILFSDMDAYELAGELLRNTSPAKAKAGQEAPEDIEIDAGPTDLVPGPAISELGALGIQIQIDKGKISIKAPKVIAKKGEKISQGAAELMGKLDIKPFTIGFIPICAFDTKENKLYCNIKIDREGTLAQLKDAYARALGFAVGVGYTSENTIKLLLQKASVQANKINRIMTGEPEPEPVVEEKIEEKKENVQEKPKEEKAPAAEGLGALFG